jgi:hypothetical protein
MGLQSVSQPIGQTGIRLRKPGVGAIASISQPIGDIMRLRKKDTNIYVNGSIWGGAIVTVGSGAGYDYATPALASAGESTHDVLILIYPGTYTDNVTTRYGYKQYFRGMGASYSDVVWTGGVGIAVASQDEQDMIVEWVTFQTAQFGFPGYPLGGSKTISKCYLSSGGGYVQDIYYSLSGSTPDVTVRYCKNNVHPGPPVGLGNFVYGYNGENSINSTSIHKCMLPEYDFISVTGTLEENDRVATPTDGYGPDYGDFLITVGPGSGTAALQSVSQPIGDIINLRRNV